MINKKTDIQGPGLRFFSVIILFLFTTLPVYAEVNVLKIYAWQETVDQVEKQFITGKNYEEKNVSPSNPGYNNKILNYILAINAELKDSITIKRIVKGYTRDFIFVDNQLYSVSDRYNDVKSRSLRVLTSNLEKYYGKSQMHSNKGIRINTYSRDNTRVIGIIDASVEVTVYYYARNLFKSLMKK